MKIVFMLVTCVLLSGCFYQTVDSYDILRATKLCGSVGQVHTITASFGGDEVVLCFDGNSYNLSKANK